MVGLQELIHKFEVGEGAGWLRSVLGAVALLAMAVIYDLREFKNFNSPEAMDQAQLARNIAEGEGFTTRCIRPLSAHLLQQRHRELAKDKAASPADPASDPTFLHVDHPDITHPPLYPVLLAGLMKVAPFRYEIPQNAAFHTYQPEIVIALFNQVLFMLAAIQLYLLARRLFDASAALISTLLFVGGELFWRFSISGLSTLLLINLFLALVSVLTRLDESCRNPEKPLRSTMLWAAAAGLLLGAGLLTRYSYGWLLLPVLVHAGWSGPQRRWVAMGAVLVAFAVVTTPWLVRNHQLSGHFFGTAGYAVYAESKSFPSDHLERALAPAFNRVEFEEFLRKLVVNGTALLQEDLPKLGGSWVSAFFLAGLMVNFRNPVLSRLRWFLVGTLAIFGLVQVMGRTFLSTENPVVNGENLLAIAAPLVFVFGTAIFLTLLDQLEVPMPEIKHLVTTGFVLLSCAPLLLVLLPPRLHPVAYPPYYPPVVQTLSGWMTPKELIMTDVPWAVSWYGRKKAIWTVINAKEDFFAVSDFQKPVSALYLTQRTTDAKFHSQMVKPQATSWEWFILQGLVKTNLPSGFPLKKSAGGFETVGHFYLTDRERWLK
ncbi:MAG: glycosyltransferase family 39 protein [Verrucomicrobia bacterium]|nr:glycosyltransferase family 39 protein [Verrucomicrobiota bacterium]